MLEYKLGRIEAVVAFWEGLQRECALWPETREMLDAESREQGRQHQERMEVLERRRRDVLSQWTKDTDKEVMARGKAVAQQKEDARREYAALRASLEARIERAATAPKAPGRRFAEAWLHKESAPAPRAAADMEKSRAKARKAHEALVREWTEVQRQHQARMDALEKQRRSILAGWTQSTREKVEARAQAVVKRKDDARRELAELRASFEALVRHANALVRKYRFLDASAGRLLSRDLGCFCIMFAEEPTKEGGHDVYVPFFGISGGGSGMFSSNDYMRNLGVPALSADEQGRKEMGSAGLRLVGRFFALREFYEARRNLGLKLPSKQAMLSYMQYMEKDWVQTRLHQSIVSIQQWNSIQRAEPAAIMAAAQLFYRMADMERGHPGCRQATIQSRRRGVRGRPPGERVRRPGAGEGALSGVRAAKEG